MRASYTVAAWYEVTARCEAPLRTGGAENDPEVLLWDADGRLLLQGSSLAGAMRGWLEQEGDGGSAVSSLFGRKAQDGEAQDGQIHPGRLRVSDGVFEAETAAQMRPRLKLNPATRTAAEESANGGSGHKFDMAHIQTGARFRFHLIWLGTEDAPEKPDDRRGEPAELQTVERLLSALHSGHILLGAQKSNGFGRISLQYQKRVYYLSRERDRRDWLRQTPPNGKPVTPVTLPDRQEVRFLLRFHADSLLIKAGEPVLVKDRADQKNERTVMPSLKEGDIPVIPGSSVKGAVRARVEQIAALKGLPASVTEALFGREAARRFQAAEQSGGPLADTGAAGIVRFLDVRLPPAPCSPISRIRINRFTGGVIRAGLFAEAPVSTRAQGGAAFPPAELEIRLPIRSLAAQEVGCALLVYALRDLAWNLYSLGSGRSVGRGILRPVELEIQLPSGKKASFRFREGFRCETAGDVETVQGWLRALEVQGA